MSVAAIKPPFSRRGRLKSTCLYSKKSSNSNELHINIEFIEGMSIEEAVTKISQLLSPQVIIWYVGCNGLRKVGVQFYKDFLISPTLRKNIKTVFWLVDLTAWGAFKNTACKINNFNACCNKIESFCANAIKCIKSSEVFGEIKSTSDLEIVNHFRVALRRNFISKASRNLPKVGILVKDIFLDKGHLLSDWVHCDANQCYSVFQYLEGCFLVKYIIDRLTENEVVSDIQIVFALPNDELKYYKDNHNSFKQDVKFLLAKQCANLNIRRVCVDIKFIAFKYGVQIDHRPYNSPGERLKGSDLSYEEVVGHVKYC